jgi:Flp pilus assembly protein TadG
MRRSRLARIIRDQRGIAMLEMAFAGPVMILLTFGTFYLGINMDRYLSMQQFARAGANMYSRGMDFSQSEAQILLDMAAVELNHAASGDTVIYLTAIAGTNSGDDIVGRYTFGNTSLGGSLIGSATSGGTVSPPVSASLPSGMTVPDGETVYAAEVFHRPAGMGFPGIIDGNYTMRARVFY